MAVSIKDGSIQYKYADEVCYVVLCMNVWWLCVCEVLCCVCNYVWLCMRM